MSIHLYFHIYKKHSGIDSRALKNSIDWIYPHTFCKQLMHSFFFFFSKQFAIDLSLKWSVGPASVSMDYELCLIFRLDHLQRRYLNFAGSAWVEERCTARGSNRTAAQSSVARTASRSHACTRVQALGKRAHVCLRPVSVYVCMLLFTGWTQTYGPSSVASNSCGVVCETVIVSGKLSQETLCSSGLKAVGVGAGGGGRWRGGSKSMWCSQQQLDACKDEAKGETLGLSLLFSPAAAATEYLKGSKFTWTPEWASRGRGPQAKTWAMADAPELSAVPCPTCPEQIDYSFRTRVAFFSPLDWRWMDISSMFSLWWWIVSWQCCFSAFI